MFTEPRSQYPSRSRTRSRCVGAYQTRQSASPASDPAPAISPSSFASIVTDAGVGTGATEDTTPATTYLQPRSRPRPVSVLTKIVTRKRSTAASGTCSKSNTKTAFEASTTKVKQKEVFDVQVGHECFKYLNRAQVVGRPSAIAGLRLFT